MADYFELAKMFFPIDGLDFSSDGQTMIIHDELMHRFQVMGLAKEFPDGADKKVEVKWKRGAKDVKLSPANPQSRN